MVGEIKQDVMMELIFNVVRFAEGAQTVIDGLDQMDRKVHQLGKGFSVVSVALGTFVGHLAGDAFRAGIRGFGKLVGAIAEAEDVADRIGNLRDIILQGLGGPLWNSIISIVQDVLGRITGAFRDSEGRWTSGFLRLRATVQVFANWLLSLWQRLMGGLEGVGKNWLDALVNGIAWAVTKAAALLRRFARFVAGIFGGRAPGEVTAEAVARTRPAEGWEPTPVYLPPEAEEAEKPKKAKAIKPVSPVDPALIAEYNALMAKAAAWTQRLADAQARVARAQAAFAKAQDALEKASEKVYDIRRKIAKLETQWAEIPERFVRGRKRQLQLELQAAEHEERERRKETDAARERLQEAQAFQREIEKTTEALKRQADQVASQIERQREKYEAYLEKLRAAAEVEEEAGAKAIDQFAELDSLTAGYVEELEGELLPAFASIEESVKSIGSSLAEAFRRGIAGASGVSDKLIEIKDWLFQVIERIRMLFAEVAKQILKVWEKVKPAIEKVKEFLPEERKSKVELWTETAEERKKAKSKAQQWGLGIEDAKPEIEKAAKETFLDTIVNAFERINEIVWKGSLIPDLVYNVVTQLEQMEVDITPVFDRMQGRLDILDKTFKGLIPTMQDFGFASGGSFKVVTVSMPNASFGAGVSEWEVKDWIWEGFHDLID
jgi:predicted  nucleic acid-binding Zn-ribbon protein